MGVKLIGGYAGGIERHRLPSGAVPPPRVSGGSGFITAASLEAASLEAARLEVIRQEAIRKAAAEKARLEAERRAKEEIAKALKIKNEQQRKAQLERIERIKERRIQASKLLSLTAIQKQQFFKEQAETIKAARFQELKKRGKKLDPKAEKLLTKVQERISSQIKPEHQPFLESRQIGTETSPTTGEEIPIFKTFYVDPATKSHRPATAEEEKFYRKETKKETEALRVPEEVSKTDIRRLEERSGKLLTNIQTGRANPSAPLELALLTASGIIIGAGEGSVAVIKSIPQIPGITIAGAKAFYNDPSMVVDIGKKAYESILRSGAEFGRVLRITPSVAIAQIGAEFLLMKGTGKVLNVFGKLTSRAITRISPRFRKIVKNMITIPSVKKGKLNVEMMRVLAGKKSKISKTLKIKLSGSLKELKESLAKQATLAGKEVTAVSAQANKLVNLIKTKKIIRKPIPGETKLSALAKKLLKRFDDGKINKKQLIKLDNLIRRETKGAGSLLERSFFADPRGRARPSRLGLADQKDASLFDILSGDVTFRASKPHIYVFEKVKVQDFPKTKIFQSIKNKLKTGKVLTQKELNELLKFQLKKSGKFKPIGKVSLEPEITLAPGEIIKKVKTLGVTLINGKRVPILAVKVVKAKKVTKALLKKAKLGKLTSAELKKLKKLLKKETGFAAQLDSSRRVGRLTKRVHLGRGLASIALTRRIKRKPKRVSKIRRIKRKPVKRKPKRVPKRKPKKVLKIIVRPPKRKPKKGVPRIGVPIRRRPPVTVPRIILRIEKKRKKKPKKKKKRGYDVYARPLKKVKKGKKPKLIKINKVPLSKRKAEDLRNWISDQSLARTSQIKPVFRKPEKPKLKVPRKYSVKTKRKFRTYKIVKGKRKPLKKGKVIEKKGYLLDTISEKKKITLKRRIAQLEKQSKIKRKYPKRKIMRVVKRKPIRRITPQQRKVMLRNLAKARRVRMINLKTSVKKNPIQKRIVMRNPIRQTKRYSPQLTIKKELRFNKGRKQIKKRTRQQKRKVTTKQLNNLKRGREIRMQNLKKRR